MKKMQTRHVLALLSALTLGTGSLWAQAAVPNKESDTNVKKAADSDDTIVLSPFVVTADEDTGYLANATSLGGRVRTDLKDIASSISVVTTQFLSDTKANDNQSLLKYTTNTEVGGIYGNYAGIGNTFINGAGESAATLVRPNANTRVRGLDSADNLRDLIKTDIPWNGFNVGRVDFQRGANSILFGLGSPAGIINASTNTAGFKTEGKVENEIGSFNSIRNTLDYNFVLVPKTLSIRLDAVYDDQKYRQQPAYNRNRTIYGAVRWDPTLFGENSTAHTSIRVNYEHGTVDSNRPHSTPPNDNITAFFDPTKEGKRLVEPNYDYQTGLFPWIQPGDPVKNAGLAQKANNWIGGVSYGGSQPSLFYNNNSTPILATQGSVNLWYAPNHTSGFPYSIAPGIVDYGTWAQNVAQYGAQQGLSATEMAKAAGGLSSIYKTRSITDTGIFDFYNNLLDGPTKKEWQGWEAYNITLEQTFLNDRLGFQAIYDRQKYHDGGENILGWSPSIAIDIAQYGAIWSPAYPKEAVLNPNAARAYVSGTGGGSTFQSDRESVIFTGRGEFRASDFMDGKSLLGRILGHHTITAVYNQERYQTEDRSYNLYAASEDWANLVGSGPGKSYDGQYGQNNGGVSAITSVVYLSPSLMGSDGTKLHLPRIMNDVVPASSVPIRYFDAHWKWPTDPTNPAYVDPTAPWTNVSNIPNATTPDSTQAANPENLVGWQTATIPIFNANKGDISQLYTSGSQIEKKVTSKAGTWQAYFFDDTIVATVGYRKDRQVTRAGQAPVDGRTKVADMNYGIAPLNPATGIDDGSTTSWGVVARLPRSLRGKLPWGSDVALSYSNGNNTRVENRYGYSANRLPDTKGKTKDISLAITMLNDRLSFKVTHYDTIDKDANISSIGGPNATLGNATSMVYNQEGWGTANAMKDLAGLSGDDMGSEWFWNWAWGKFDGAPGSDYSPGSTAAEIANNAAFQNNPATILEKAAIKSWQDQMKAQSWYDLYGWAIHVDKVKAGDYNHAFTGYLPRDGAGPGGPTGKIDGQYPTGTIDNRSTGWEFELTGKPIKNLDVSMNASKQFARQTALGADLVNYINASYAKYVNTPAGDLRQWWAGDDTYRKVFLRSVWSAYQFQAQTNGKMVAEMSPWRANLSATYRFDRGLLKGAFLGGSYRWEQGTILGYYLNSTQDNLDVNKPIWSKSEDWIDLWAGYEFKLSKKLSWRTQLNLRNVGQNPRLHPISVQPDGSPGQYRIEEGMTWVLSNTLSF